MIWCALPLIVVFSLCYAATRHEDLDLILPHAAKFGGWLTFFLALVVIVIAVVQWSVH